MQKINCIYKTNVLGIRVNPLSKVNNKRGVVFLIIECPSYDLLEAIAKQC